VDMGVDMAAVTVSELAGHSLASMASHS
jgi:hypothetical protein